LIKESVEVEEVNNNENDKILDEIIGNEKHVSEVS
jgi:hypothetical protein